MSDLYLCEESASDNEDFRSTIFQLFQCEHEQKKTCGNESHEREAKHIYASAADLLHIRKGNPNWYKCRHCKIETREIDCLCCREADSMLIASAKIPERGKHSYPCYATA